MKMSLRSSLAVIAMLWAMPAAAQNRDVPYWASISVDELNMRVGPGEDYRIIWVYRRENLPVKVLRIKEGWRWVEDPDGARGWVLGQFLSRTRGMIVKGRGLTELHEKPDAASRLLWRAESGVSGKLGDCNDGWCQIDVAGRKGFVEQARLWGAGEP